MNRKRRSAFLIKERRPNRLKGYDYNQQGYYYITICTKNQLNLFGEILNNIMHLSQTGEIANRFWIAIPEHFKNIELDEFIIMPNHIHGIIFVNNGDAGDNGVGNAIMGNNGVGNADLRSPHSDDHLIHTVSVDDYDRTKMVVSKIIHGFKSSVTREIRRQLNDFNFAWQKSYYDYIIHDEDDLNRIREYIYNNPANWDTDGDRAMGELN